MFESWHRLGRALSIAGATALFILPATVGQAGALEDEARRQLAFCYGEIEEDRFDRAKASAESALRLYPALYDAMVCKAMAYEGMENYDLSRAILLAYMEMHSGTEPSDQAVALKARLEERAAANSGQVAAKEAPAKTEEKGAKKGGKKASKKPAKKETKKAGKETKASKPAASAASNDDSVADASGESKQDGSSVKGEDEAAKNAAKKSKEKEVAASAKAADPDQQKKLGMAVGIGMMGGGVGLLVPGIAVLADSIGATNNLNEQREQAALLGYGVDTIDAQITAESANTGGGAALAGIGAAVLATGVVLTIAFGTK